MAPTTGRSTVLAASSQRESSQKRPRRRGTTTTTTRRRRRRKVTATVVFSTLMMLMMILVVVVVAIAVMISSPILLLDGDGNGQPSSMTTAVFVVSGFSFMDTHTNNKMKMKLSKTMTSPPRLQWGQQQERKQQSSFTSLFSSSFDSETSVSSSSAATSAAITVIDPATQCEVVLLGCFHGTQSSADDVERVVDCDTDVIVLELCTSRFVDLRRMQEKQRQEEQEQEKQLEQNQDVQYLDSSSSMKLNKAIKSSWPVRYVDTVATTARKKGIGTGVAAGLLIGVSGLQSAMSGFVPGLEFTTALDHGKTYNCDIVLADQDVDETLRKLGSLPIDVWKTLAGSSSNNKESFAGSSLVDDNSSRNNKERSFIEECMFHLTTLKGAVLGDMNSAVPQVQIFNVLLRDKAAVRDLIRLTVPALITIVLSSRLLVLILRSVASSDWSFFDLSAVDDMNMMTSAMSSRSSSDGLLEEGIVSWTMHMIASSFILLAGFFAMTPIIKIILTERDEILTEGILAACQRAGNGGRVVAVLGLLHVNGVAQRIMTSGEEEERSLLQDEDITGGP